MKKIQLQAKTIALQQIQLVYQEHDDFIEKNPYGQMLLDRLDQWANREDSLSIGILPLLTCEANGGKPEQVVPILAAWQLTQFAAKLFDDVEDGDISCHKAQTINVAMGLLSVAQLVLTALPGYDTTWCQAFNKMLLRACAGQHDDLAFSHNATSYADPEHWYSVAQAKSGEFLSWAAWAGASIADKRDSQKLTCYRNYGRSLGVLLQIADDFGGIWNSDDNNDLATGALSLPICYSLMVADETKRSDLLQLLIQAKAGNTVAADEARQCLIDLGAQTYLLAIAFMEYKRAVISLEQCNLSTAKLNEFVALLLKTMPGLKLLDRVSNARLY
ncbi:MAG: polyprenyl synthetase family protein [Caldilineaceae bacterium]